MSPNDADGMANSVDPDQTAPLGAVWSGSALFAQAYLSENLGSLRYNMCGLWLNKTKIAIDSIRCGQRFSLQCICKSDSVVHDVNFGFVIS